MKKSIRYALSVLGVLMAVYIIGYCVYIFSIV